MAHENMTMTKKEGGHPGTTLDLASIGLPLTVQHVQAPPVAPEWGRWLEELGFIFGERVMLMARALPGGDPLVVRVGQSTFALRRAEAACVRVSAVDALLERGRS
jgi:ferrous iron transport protein A